MADPMTTVKKILNTDCLEYRNSPVKFGICMATYYRHNGNTKGYLTRSLKTIVDQTAKNWHLYLVGDKYEDNYEFEELAKLIPATKITFVNLPTAPERENLSGNDLWKVGGVNAMNHANKLALADNCDYILHYDDDDTWSTKKIQILNYVVSIFNTPSFLFHYSTFIGKNNLPKQEINELSVNNCLLEEKNCIHSSFCAHKSLLKGFEYSGYVLGKQQYVAGDRQFVRYINEYIETNKGSCVLIPLLLSTHDSEGESLDLIPKDEHKILSHLERKTPETSALVKTISETMSGNTFHHHYHILYSLADLIKKPSVLYSEIGTFNGGSLCLMLQHPKVIDLLSIDPFHLERTSIDIVKANIKKFNKFRRNVVLTEQFSNNSAFLQKLRDNNFMTDILFVDGDHSYKAVIEDFTNFKDFINPGGFMVFDDYQDAEYSPDVKTAVHDIVAEIKAKGMPFRIIGNPFNFGNVHPKEFKFLNEFIIQRV